MEIFIISPGMYIQVVSHCFFDAERWEYPLKAGLVLMDGLWTDFGRTLDPTVLRYTCSIRWVNEYRKQNEAKNQSETSTKEATKSDSCILFFDMWWCIKPTFHFLLGMNIHKSQLFFGEHKGTSWRMQNRRTKNQMASQLHWIYRTIGISHFSIVKVSMQNPAQPAHFQYPSILISFQSSSPNMPILYYHCWWLG
jgi:hypothetical protein